MEINLSELEPRHAHDLLSSTVIPRPIAWVSTINMQDQMNLAPFSFFTGVTWSPPVIAFSVVNRPDGSSKDTVLNIQDIPEFVVHIVSVDLRSTMEKSAQAIPYGTDESAIPGIQWIPSKKVKPNRIKEAKIAFECTLEQCVIVGNGGCAGNLILGKIELVHFQDNILINDREVNWSALDVLGRLSGNRFCAVRSVIESESKY